MMETPADESQTSADEQQREPVGPIQTLPVSSELEQLRQEVERLKQEESIFMEEKQQALEEAKIVDETISTLKGDALNFYRDNTSRPAVSTTAKTWKWGVNGKSLEGFTLTDLREDVMFRMKNPEQLYTLEESKILLREIVRLARNHAKQDIENLIFLSKLRTDKLFPKPIVQQYLLCGEGGFPVENLGEWLDSEEEHELIYTEEGMKKIVQSLIWQDGSDTESINSDSLLDIDLDVTEEEEEERYDEEEKEDSDDEDNERESVEIEYQTERRKLSSVTAKRKMRLQSLVVEVNRSLVKLVDSALKQRKERLLLSATILKELEDSSST